MAKLLQPKKHKVNPKQTEKVPKKVVLIGTYKTGQLASWRGYYNYPIGEDDQIDEASAKAVNELWLFKGTKDPKFFAAEFIGIKTREELKAEYKYPAKGKAHGERYLLFRISKTERYEPSSGLADQVIIRVKDFKTAPKYQKLLKSYLESEDRNDPGLAKMLPSIVSKIPMKVLRVCETTMQLDFTMALFTPEANYQNPPQEGYTVASLFAGCGGLDLGFVGGFDFLGKHFENTGFKVVWANELSPAACRTYTRNFGSGIVCGDIKEAIETLPKEVDVVMGGFPCQDISINGKMEGINGKRSSLYTYIVEAVKKTNPKVFVAENVGSLMLKQNEYSFKTILKDFRSLGYDVSYHVYHAELYGVPQTRERIIFVGTRQDMKKFQVPHPLETPVITAGDALRDLENHPQDKTFSHVWSEAAPSGEQGNRRMVENRPGYTIRAECHGNIQFHYRLPRRLSMREAARIQSFPDSFVFPCGIRETERQIGNAVPPVLAWHIANEVKKVLGND